MELVGKNVLVRSIKPDDVDLILKWGYGSTESFFLLNFPLLFNRDDLAQETARQDSEILLSVNKADRKPLSLLKLGPIRLPEKQTQLRFTIGTMPEYSAENAREAPALLLEHFFKQAGIRKVQAYTLEFEKEYELLLQKLGFKKEGSYQHHFYHKERYWAVNIFGLFRNDFIR
jgi:hypothetical protein